jgi:hypothetical protein
MKQHFGNYLGICINNQDPEYRGRCQIFIPHIMPALYEGWNDQEEDITIECLGDNLQNGIPSDIVNKLIQILPWAEAALPVVGTSVAGSYNFQTGNFNQTSTPENVALSLNQTSFDTGLGIGTDNSGYVNKAQFQNYLNSAISKSGLNNWKPSDAAKYGIDGSSASWTNFFYHLANRESSLRVNTVGDVGKFVGNSNGLFQLSPLDYSNYSKQMKAAGIQPGTTIDGKPAFSQQQLTDPVTNTNAAIVIASTLIKQNGAIGDNENTGAARYWGPLRKGWTPPASGKINITQPSSAPDPSALPPTTGPFHAPEPPVQTSTQDTPPGGATVGVVGSTSSTFGPGQAGQLWSKAKGDLSSTSCGKIARLFDKELYGDSYFNRVFSSETGFAGANRSAPYFTNADPKDVGPGGAYYRQLPAGQIPSQLPLGTKFIFQSGTSAAGKKYGHITTVADNQLLGSGRNESFSRWADINSGRVTVLLPTEKANNAFKAKYGTDLPLYSTNDITKGTNAVAFNDVGADGPDQQSGMVKNTTPSQPFPLDTTGMPQGLFAHPSPGAMLWVFFREGDPMFPVYFAASYGTTEWQNMQKANSTPLNDAQNGGSEITSSSVIRPNNAGAIQFTGTVDNSGQDRRAVRVAHANGGYFELNPSGSMQYSPNEQMRHTGGTDYSYCLNREEWTQGTNNQVTLGDMYVIIGNPSQANINAIEALTEKVKQVNAKMLEDSTGNTKKGSGAKSTANTRSEETKELANKQWKAAPAAGRNSPLSRGTTSQITAASKWADQIVNNEAFRRKVALGGTTPSSETGRGRISRNNTGGASGSW